MRHRKKSGGRVFRFALFALCVLFFRTQHTHTHTHISSLYATVFQLRSTTSAFYCSLFVSPVPRLSLCLCSFSHTTGSLLCQPLSLSLPRSLRSPLTLCSCLWPSFSRSPSPFLLLLLTHGQRNLLLEAGKRRLHRRRRPHRHEHSDHCHNRKRACKSAHLALSMGVLLLLFRESLGRPSVRASEPAARSGSYVLINDGEAQKAGQCCMQR